MIFEDVHRAFCNIHMSALYLDYLLTKIYNCIKQSSKKQSVRYFC